MPFDYSNQRTFALKCIAYMGFGFALPFIAVGWQWFVCFLLHAHVHEFNVFFFNLVLGRYKPGGYKNPS